MDDFLRHCKEDVFAVLGSVKWSYLDCVAIL